MRRRDGVSTWHRACEEAGVRYAPSPRHFVVGWPSVGVPGPCRPMCGMSAMLARAGRIPSPRPSHRCADVETAPNHIFPCFAPRYVSRGRCLRRASSRGHSLPTRASQFRRSWVRAARSVDVECSLASVPMFHVIKGQTHASLYFAGACLRRLPWLHRLRDGPAGGRAAGGWAARRAAILVDHSDFRVQQYTSYAAARAQPRVHS